MGFSFSFLLYLVSRTYVLFFKGIILYLCKYPVKTFTSEALGGKRLQECFIIVIVYKILIRLMTIMLTFRGFLINFEFSAYKLIEFCLNL